MVPILNHSLLKNINNNIINVIQDIEKAKILLYGNLMSSIEENLGS